jgi:hypothetical protein
MYEVAVLCAVEKLHSRYIKESRNRRRRKKKMYSVSYIDLNKGQWVRKGSFLKKAVIGMLQDSMVIILEIDLIPEFDIKEKTSK